jgi:hypothetical protein
VDQTEIDEVACTVYRETAEFYARISPRIRDDALFGFKILYGPPLARAPLMFAGEQPGGGVGGPTDDPQSVLDLERKTWPVVTEYATASWRLAHAIRAVYDAEFPGLLRRCTGTNENFFRAPSRDHYHRNVNGELRSEIGYFCKPRVQSLVRAIEPDHVVCIGLEIFRRITGSTTVAIRSRITGDPLVETGTFAGRRAVGVPHLTGVPLRRDERAVIYDYLRTLV